MVGYDGRVDTWPSRRSTAKRPSWPPWGLAGLLPKNLSRIKCGRPLYAVGYTDDRVTSLGKRLESDDAPMDVAEV